MQYISLLAVALFAVTSVGSAAAAEETVLSYRGRLLRPQTGSGVAMVKNLHFKVSGHLPIQGRCRADFKIISVYDGSFSLKKALADGFTASPENGVKICSDAQTGALSESLHVKVGLYSGGNLVAAYAWLSSDPRHGRAADTVISYANIEYHVSEAKRVGRFAPFDGP